MLKIFLIMFRYLLDIQILFTYLLLTFSVNGLCLAIICNIIAFPFVHINILFSWRQKIICVHEIIKFWAYLFKLFGLLSFILCIYEGILQLKGVIFLINSVGILCFIRTIKINHSFWYILVLIAIYFLIFHAA